MNSSNKLEHWSGVSFDSFRFPQSFRQEVPKGLNSHHKELRPETFQKILSQFNDDFGRTVLCDLFSSIDIGTLHAFHQDPVAKIHKTKEFVVDIRRSAAFSSFRRSKVTLYPLIMFQSILCLYFGFFIFSILKSFPVSPLSYPCLGLHFATGVLGCFILIARCYFVCVKKTPPKYPDSPPSDLTPSGYSSGQENDLTPLEQEEEILESLSFRPDFYVPVWLPRLEVVWTFVLIFVSCLNSLFLAEQSQAHPLARYSQTPHRMADGMMIFSLLMPSFGYLVTKALSFRQAALCWALSLAHNTVVIIINDMYLSKPILCIFAVLSLFLLVEIHRQDYVAFVLATNLQVALAENKWQSDQSKSNELKHMLGNIAHDIKTVSFERFYL
jgi:hypothetical protein